MVSLIWGVLRVSYEPRVNSPNSVIRGEARTDQTCHIDENFMNDTFLLLDALVEADVADYF
jgi:hypothetical protein